MALNIYTIMDIEPNVNVKYKTIMLYMVNIKYSRQIFIVHLC